MKQLLYKTVFWAMLSLSFHRAGAQFFGIGTPLPQTTLDVAGTGPNHLIRLSDNSGVSAVRLALNSVFAGMPYIGTDNPTGFGIVANNLQLITASKVGNVGINTIYPNASAILDIESNNRGLLIPRMTGAQMAAIVAPATGLMVFDTDANTFYFFNGTAWSRVDTQSELERISEGGKTGYRILNRLPANYGDIGQEAVDLSFSGVVSSTLGATGSQSFATGQQTAASGTASTAMGFGTSAMGLVATAIGNLCTASGNYAVALGASNISAGTAATTLGLNNRATAAYSLAGGSNSRALGQSSFAMGEQGYTMGSNSAAIGTRDSAIGESSFAAGSNAAARGLASVAMGSFAKANGNYSFAAVRHSAALGISSVAMGQESVALGNHAIALSLGDSATGTASFAAGYFSKALGEYAVAIGREVEASGNSSLALGYQTLANGSSATAFGNGTLAIGSAATAMGFNTAARGSNSTAMGNGTNASGSAAMAMGFGTVAIGNNATAMGNATVAKSFGEVAMGVFNDTLAIANGTAFRADTNRLFTVGNGPSASNRRTAFVIQQDGAVGIGVRRPTSLLHVNGEVGINGTNTLELGADVAGKEINAGKIGYNTFTAEALDVVGAGNSLATRRIKLWAEGGLELAGTIVQENLQAPVLLGGWQNFGAAFATAGYWEDKEGMVHLRGLIGNGNASGGTTLFNLPAGYRPSGGRLIFTVLTSGGMGRVDVNTNGDVIIDNIPGNAWLNLTGISFRTN